jgi:hypothetical protein
MKNVSKLFLFVFVVLLQFAAFAQDKADEETDEGIANRDGPAENDVPIDGELIFLLVAGMTFSFYALKKNTSNQKL